MRTSSKCATPMQCSAVQLRSSFHFHRYLPGFKFPTNVVANPSLADTVKDATLLIFVLPHQVCACARGFSWASTLWSSHTLCLASTTPLPPPPQPVLASPLPSDPAQHGSRSPSHLSHQGMRAHTAAAPPPPPSPPPAHIFHDASRALTMTTRVSFLSLTTFVVPSASSALSSWAPTWPRRYVIATPWVPTVQPGGQAN